MACRASFVQRHAAKHLLALAVMALLVPIAAQGASFSSSIQTPSSTCLPGLLCIFNTGGVATGGTQGLTMNGLLGSKTSTVFQIGTVGGGNSNLGTLSLTTGALLTGSLKTGGTFAAGTLTINVTNYNGFSGTLFAGTFGNSTIPITWQYDGKVGQFYQYELIGPISGTWEGGTTVSGQTAQLYFHSKTQYNGGQISLASGTTAIATPEPGALGLTGMGLVGMGIMVRRKFQREQCA
jgi:hypothetical protein